MLVHGDINPGTLSVEQMPNKPLFALVSLYENVHEYEEKHEEYTYKCFEYDEYHLELPYYENLKADIEANIGPYLNSAKENERIANVNPADTQDLAEKNAERITETITSFENAMCEQDVIAETLAETISAVEDAICEQDIITNERISAIEDALCELDK